MKWVVRLVRLWDLHRLYMLLRFGNCLPVAVSPLRSPAIITCPRALYVSLVLAMDSQKARLYAVEEELTLGACTLHKYMRAGEHLAVVMASWCKIYH